MKTPKPITATPQNVSLAVTSLVLGILSVTTMSILTGIPAMITGIMSLKHPENRGLAITGIVLGSISLLLFTLVMLLIVVVIGFVIASPAEYYYDPGSYIPETALPEFQQRT